MLTPKSTPLITSSQQAEAILYGYTAYANQGNFYDDKLKELKAKSLPKLKIDYWKNYGVANISPTLAKEKSLFYVDISGLLYAMENKLS